MKRLFLMMTLLACHHHDESHEKDDDTKKKEGSHTADDKHSAAEEAIHAYESAGDCDAKTQLIVYGKSHRDLLGAQCAPRKTERFETDECDKLAPALTQCHAMARRDGDKTRYWLVRQPNGQFLVDFLATERPVQLADLAARLPTTPSVARIRGYSSITYKGPFRDKKKTHFAMRVKAPKTDRTLWGYAYALRDSPEGIALASASKSGGDEVELTVAITFPTKDPEVMQIEKVFGTDFFETEAEHAFGKDGGT